MKNNRILQFIIYLSFFISSASAQNNYWNNSDDNLKNSFKGCITTLSSPEFEGRAAMTRGDTLAVAYILDQLKNLDGLELLADGGLQRFGFGGFREINSDSTHFRLNSSKLKLGVDFLPSVYSWEGGFSGKAVYLGQGKASDYENVDVQGKIIVIDGTLNGDETFVNFLFDRGALAEKAKVAGIVIVVPELKPEDSRWALSKNLRFTCVTPAVGKRIIKGAKVDYHTKIENGKRGETRTNNIVVRVSAPIQNNPAEECIVVGAHYDHLGKSKKDGEVSICPGADDNASGIAALLEFARYFSANRQLLKRDVVLIAFGAEERGLVGSSYFVDQPSVPIQTIKGMFNFDMLGRMRDNNLNIRGIGTFKEAFPTLATIPNPNDMTLTLIMSGKMQTDYASFYRKNIPALSFSTGIHPDYHSPQDTEDKINYDGMLSAFHYISSVLDHFAFESNILTVQ